MMINATVIVKKIIINDHRCSDWAICHKLCFDIIISKALMVAIALAFNSVAIQFPIGTDTRALINRVYFATSTLMAYDRLKFEILENLAYDSPVAPVSLIVTGHDKCR